MQSSNVTRTCFHTLTKVCEQLRPHTCGNKSDCRFVSRGDVCLFGVILHVFAAVMQPDVFVPRHCLQPFIVTVWFSVFVVITYVCFSFLQTEGPVVRSLDVL